MPALEGPAAAAKDVAQRKATSEDRTDPAAKLERDVAACLLVGSEAGVKRAHRHLRITCITRMSGLPLIKQLSALFQALASLPTVSRLGVDRLEIEDVPQAAIDLAQQR